MAGVFVSFANPRLTEGANREHGALGSAEREASEFQ